MNDTQNNVAKKLKQVLAILAIIIILLLYIVTLILAIMNNSYTKTFFEAALFSTFFLPIMLYLFIWIGNVLKSYNPNLKENKKIQKKPALPKNDNAEDN